MFLLLLFLFPQVSISACPVTCRMLGRNGHCDSTCDTLACNYDNRECIPDCPSGCLSSMIGNGICEPVCNNAACLFDGNDCVGFCSPGCSLTMLGNGICESQCNNIWCQYDGGDCTCTAALLNNGVCDWICDSWEFGFDMQDCAEFIYVNASHPETSGDGSLANPYRSLDAALTHPFAKTEAGLCFLPGTHNLSRSDPALVWFSANITHLFVTCRFCQGCDGPAELLITGNQVQFLSASNVTSVLVENLEINGVARLLDDCTDLTCAFCFIWHCNDTECTNEFSQVVPLNKVPAFCLGFSCFETAKTVFTFNATAEVIMGNLSFVNIGGVSSLVYANGSYSFISNVQVRDVELTAAALVVTGPMKNETVGWKIYSATTRSVLFVVSKVTQVVSSTVTSIDIRNVNVFMSTREIPCSTITHEASALRLTDMNDLTLSNVYVYRLFNFAAGQVVSAPVINIASIDHSVVKNCTLKQVQATGGGLVFTYLPTYITNFTSLNIEVEGVTVLDSVFTSVNSAVTVTSIGGALNPLARLNGILVERTLGSGLSLLFREQAAECGMYKITDPKMNMTWFDPRTCSVENVRLNNNTMITAAMLILSNVCHGNFTNVSVSSNSNTGLNALTSEMFLMNIQLSDMFYTTNTSIMSLPNALLCIRGTTELWQVTDLNFLALEVTGNICSSGSVIWVHESDSVSFSQSRFSNNSAVSPGSGLVLLDNNQTFLSFDQVTFCNNSVDLGVINVISPEQVQVTNSFVSSNRGHNNAGIFADSAEVYVSNVLFEAADAPRGAAISIRTSIGPASLVVGDSTFIGNCGVEGRDLLIEDTNGLGINLHILNSAFRAGCTGSMLLIDSGTRLLTASIENSLVSDTSASDYKGNLYLAFSIGVLTFRNVTWDHCHNTDLVGGSILYSNIGPDSPNSPTFLSFQSCVFTRAFAAVFFLIENEHIVQTAVLRNSTFSQNRALLFDLMHANLQVESAFFQDNSNAGEGIVRTIFNSTVVFTQCYIEGNDQAGMNDLIELGDESWFLGTSLKFVKNVVRLTIVSATNSYVTLLDTDFLGNVISDGSICRAQNSVVQMRNVRYEQNWCNQVLNDFFLTNVTGCNVTISSEGQNWALLRQSFLNASLVSISNALGVFIEAEDSWVDINGLVGQNVWAETFITAINTVLTGTSVTLIDLTEAFSLIDSTFTLELSHFQGMTQPIALQNSVLMLTHSQFLENTGCISGVNSTVWLTHSLVQTTLGASALALIDTGLKTVDVVFNANSADSGGALNLRCPTLRCLYEFQNSTFTGNRAIKGGAVYYIDTQPDLSNCSMVNNTAVYGRDIGTVPYMLTNTSEFPVAVSGEVYPFPELALLDEMGQVMVADNQSIVLVTASEGVILEGSSRITLLEGRAQFQGVSLISTPGQSASVQLQVSGVPIFTVAVDFRLCETGEIQLPDKSCKRCDPMTYSFNVSDESCSQCPAGAVCYGGAEVYPIAGYWRSSNLTDLFYQCTNVDACVGSPTRKDPMGECALGYSSNLCGACSSMYYQFSNNTCKQCFARYITILISLILFIGYFAFLTKIVAGSISSAEKSDTSLHLKLLMNYLQVTMMLSEFRLQWPELMTQMFNSSSVAGNSSQPMFTVDCFSDLSTSSLPFVFIKHTIVTLMPLVQILLSCLFWGVVAIVRRNKKYFYDHNISTIMSLMLLLHSTVSSSVMSLFACRNLDNGASWLLEDMSVRCWEGEHEFFSLVLGLPSLVVWVIGFPFLLIAVLVGRRKQLDQPGTKLRYGFIFSGYQGSFFFWEAIVILRKVSVKAVSVVLSQTGDMQKVMAANTVIVTMMALQVAYKPYLQTRINRIETLSMSANFITLTLGAFFNTETSAFTLQLLSWSIVIVNAGFLGYWIYSLLQTSVINRCFRRKTTKVSCEMTELEPNCARDSPFCSQFDPRQSRDEESISPSLGNI